MSLIGSAANQIILGVELMFTILIEPGDNALGLRHDFGADAISSQQQ